MRISRKTRDRRGGHQSKMIIGDQGFVYDTKIARRVIKKQTVKRKRVAGTKELHQWLLDLQHEQAENDLDDQHEADDHYLDWLDAKDQDWDDPMDEPDRYDPFDDFYEFEDSFNRWGE